GAWNGMRRVDVRDRDDPAVVRLDPEHRVGAAETGEREVADEPPEVLVVARARVADHVAHDRVVAERVAERRDRGVEAFSAELDEPHPRPAVSTRAGSRAQRNSSISPSRAICTWKSSHAKSARTTASISARD